MEDLSDEELMSLVGKGDESAFSLLVSRHKDLVYGTVYKMLGSYAGEAEDVSQQIFIKVYRAAPRYRVKSGAKFTTWLLTICRNTVFTQLKKSSKVRSEPLAYYDGEEESESNLPDPTVSNAADQLLQKEMKEALLEAMNQLPENQRTALILRQYEQLDYEEISKVMGTSLQAVKSLLFRARETLKQELKRYLSAT